MTIDPMTEKIIWALFENFGHQLWVTKTFWLLIMVTTFSWFA
jgi:hypothetical protein